MTESSTRKARHIKKDIITELPGNVQKTKKDIITELPRNLQETILCFLPIRDAVRTSILSRKWRRSWTAIPHLIFDDEFVHSMKDKLYRYGNPELAALKFVSVINKCLLLHKGPILNFFLTIPRYYCNDEIIHDYIDQWISFLAKNGLKKLILESSRLQENTTHHFSSLGLTHLRLSSVLFRYTPNFGVFTNLKKLQLVDATSDFGHSIFDCPVLEKLTLIICKGLFHTNFRAPNLKYLHQIYDDVDSEYSFAGLENLTDFSFMLTRNGLTMATKTLNVVQVLGSLHKIEKFSVGMDYMKYLAAGGCPDRLPEPLPHLRTLNICDIDFTDLYEVSCLLCMIRSAPNLCELHVSAAYDKVDENPKNFWVEDSEDCTSIGHLQTVTFSNLNGDIAELELIKFLLAHSPLLKTMFIHYNWTKKRRVELAMAKEMLQYSRASSSAQIRYLKDLYEMDGFDYGLWNRYSISSYPWIYGPN